MRMQTVSANELCEPAPPPPYPSYHKIYSFLCQAKAQGI